MNDTIPCLFDEIQELLKCSMSDVFSTMANSKTFPAKFTDFRGGQENLVAGSVGFFGELSGVVYVYVRAPFARTLASRMLGLDEIQLQEEDLINDVIGELTNMIGGAVKSRLCDSGAQCVLSIPTVVRGQSLRGGPVCSSQSRLFSLRCDDEPILIEFLLKPSVLPEAEDWVRI